VAESRRDDFPNHFVGDLVPTERGWVVVPPTCGRRRGRRASGPRSRRYRSYPVASLHSACCFPRPVVGGTSAVAFEHAVAAPAHEALKVALLAAG